MSITSIFYRAPFEDVEGVAAASLQLPVVPDWPDIHPSDLLEASGCVCVLETPASYLHLAGARDLRHL